VVAGGAAGFTDSSRFHIAEFLPLYWKIPIEGTYLKRGECVSV
jgi:hypothetical protein